MSCKCAKFHSFIIKGTIFTPNCWTTRGPLFLNKLCTTQRPTYLLTYLLRPGIIFPQVLIEHCIYLFGIVQTSISLDSVNVCSSRSTSIWVTMLGLVDLKFYSTTMLQS